MAKKFSPRQIARLQSRRGEREARRIIGERYVEDHQLINQYDIWEAVDKWY